MFPLLWECLCKIDCTRRFAPVSLDEEGFSFPQLHAEFVLLHCWHGLYFFPYVVLASAPATINQNARRM